ncbi:MAG: alpha-galactosidase [Chloroflexota bacterium]
MELKLDAQGLLTVALQTATLRKAVPVVNGLALDDLRFTILESHPENCWVRYESLVLEGGSFALEAQKDGEIIHLRYWLENLPAGLQPDSFGLRFQAVENLRQYLCSGYFSWDGSFYVQPDALGDFEPYEARPETGYALTQILPAQGTGSLVIGFERHDRFQHTFTFDTRRLPPSLTILTLWDQKDRHGLDRCTSEKLLLFEHPEVEEGLREWARQVAAASSTPPRLSSPPITGWCSWYNLYASINEENILHHLHSAADVARRENLCMRVFQIDDGFTPEMGDWLEVKPQFPRGMKPVLDDIRSAGFVPGLWIAPFMVGNRSHLYQEHPDWVVQDRLAGGPLVQMSFYGEFRWHKRSEEYYILDATHPEAFAYLRQVFHIWRREWGCEYFKTDFMHFGTAHGPKRAVWHTPGATRIETWRRVAEMIRQEIGEAIWLGCGFPLWAAVGLVDGVRIGRDVGVEWSSNLSAQSLLRDQSTRNFANQVLWQADPDCVLLRQRFHHLTDNELRSLALFAGMIGGVTMTSDDLDELSPERLRLWKLILPAEHAFCRFPLLGQTGLSYIPWPADLHSQHVRHVARADDPVLLQVRKFRAGKTAVLALNTGETTLKRVYPLQKLGVSSPKHVSFWSEDIGSEICLGELRLEIAPHECILCFLSDRPDEPFPEAFSSL